jgi:hypothetical protein
MSLLDTTHYINIHDDLIKATTGMSPVQKHKFAINHYNTYGIRERRMHRNIRSESSIKNKKTVETVETILPRIKHLIKNFKKMSNNKEGPKIRDKAIFVEI